MEMMEYRQYIAPNGIEMLLLVEVIYAVTN